MMSMIYECIASCCLDVLATVLVLAVPNNLVVCACVRDDIFLRNMSRASYFDTYVHLVTSIFLFLQCVMYRAIILQRRMRMTLAMIGSCP
jgi:hypothetical protein